VLGFARGEGGGPLVENHGNRLLITIEPITRDNVLLFKSVRLQALQDSPMAFGSTYAREVGFPESEWLARLERWNGETGMGFLAVDGDAGCGIAGALLDLEDESRAQLVSMWTAPTHRHKGVGQLLVDAVLNWAEQRKVKAVPLMVVSTNDSAIRFYERLGFAMTGKTEPYPNDPAILEYEMARTIS
jgi:ribosomal protein S18 acetylase RimI-like enzyme